MAYVNPKQYREFYNELYNSDNIHKTLDEHYIKNKKIFSIPYSKFILKFIKYLVWNINNSNIVNNIQDSKVIKAVGDIKDFEVKKGVQSKILNDPFKFRPINKKSLTILGIITTFYNTDATEIIPETGKMLQLVEYIFNSYNENTSGFGLVLGINCKHTPFIIDKNGKRIYI